MSAAIVHKHRPAVVRLCANGIKSPRYALIEPFAAIVIPLYAVTARQPAAIDSPMSRQAALTSSVKQTTPAIHATARQLSGTTNL